MPPSTATVTTTGVLPAPGAILQKNAQHSQAASKPPAPRLKLVVRRLAPGLTQAEFEAVLGDEWKLGAGKIDWMQYKPGKVTKDAAKPSRPSRAYLRITNDSYSLPLADKVRQSSFLDAKSSSRDTCLIGPPALEFAPYSRVPGGRRKKDARQGTIDQDPEFKEFLESLTNPVTKPAHPDASADAASKDTRITSTPLIEFIREKKAAKEKQSAKGSQKHGRGEAREDKAEKASDKKSGKSGKEAATPEKKRGKERAAKEGLKILHKVAVNNNANKQAKDTSISTHMDTGTAPEKKRERGDANIAAKMVQRHLGIGPTGSGARRRGGKREATDAPATPKAADSTPAKSKDKENTPITPTPVAVEKAATPTPTSAKKDSRPTRAERRAHKAAQAEKTNQTEGQSSSKTPAPETLVPVILKKPPSGPAAQTQQPKQQQQSVKEPPKGPAASRQSNNPVKAIVKAPVVAASPPPAPTSRQAFLKHANASQGITEALIEEALALFGAIGKVEIDKRKGFAYVDFVEPLGLQKAIAASPVKVAQGAVQVLEKRDRIGGRLAPPVSATAPVSPTPPTAPAARGGGSSFRGGRSRGGRGGRGPGGATTAGPSNTASPTASAPVIAPSAPVPTPAP